MKYSEVVCIIKEIENKFPVDKWVIDKIHIWPIIRIELQFKFYFSKVDKLKNNIKLIRYAITAIHMLANFLKYIYAYFADFRRNDNINKPVDIVFLTHSLYRTLLNGLYYDRLCGPFIDAFQDMNIKTLTLEAAEGLGDLSYRYRLPRYKPSIFIQHRLDYLKIKNILFREKPNLENEKLEVNNLITNI